MTEPVKRYSVTIVFEDNESKRYPLNSTIKVFKQVDVVLAADYERLEQECERLRLDNLSKNGSIKAFGAQIAALQRAVKNRDKLKARAEAGRDDALKQAEGLRGLLVEISSSERRGIDWKSEIDSALSAKPCRQEN